MVSLGERTGWIGSAVSEGNPRGGVTQQTWSELAEKQSIQIWQNLTLGLVAHEKNEDDFINGSKSLLREAFVASTNDCVGQHDCVWGARLSKPLRCLGASTSCLRGMEIHNAG